jgi:hypothetical protein
MLDPQNEFEISVRQCPALLPQSGLPWQDFLRTNLIDQVFTFQIN